MSTLLPIFAANLLPILLVAGAGFLLQRALRPDPRPLAQVAFYILSPALVFQLLVRSNIQAAGLMRMFLLTLFLVLALSGLSWLTARSLGLDRPATAAFVLSATFMNAGNYGLPLNQFAFGDEGLAWASLFFVSSAMLTNSLGVYTASTGRASPAVALRGLLKVPAMYAIPLAFLVRGLQWGVPLPLARGVDLAAAAAIPTMLLLLGMQIGRWGWPGDLRFLGLSGAFRLLLSPALALLLANLLNLDGLALNSSIIEAAMPTAVMTTVLAVEYDARPDLVSGVVLATTLLSPLTVTPLLAWLL